MENLNLKQSTDNRHWYTGKVKINDKEYTVNMLRFEEPSCYGIAEGRISKLFIFTTLEKIFWYDREFVYLPNHDETEVQKIYEAIVKEYN